MSPQYGTQHSRHIATLNGNTQTLQQVFSGPTLERNMERFTNLRVIQISRICVIIIISSSSNIILYFELAMAAF